MPTKTTKTPVKTPGTCYLCQTRGPVQPVTLPTAGKRHCCNTCAAIYED